MAVNTKITQRAVAALKPRVGKDTYLRCIEPRGFFLRCKPSGEKTFGLRYRNPYGRESYVALGSAHALTVEEARRIAKDLVEKVRSEAFDPAAQRRKNRTALTLGAVCDQYLAHITTGGLVGRAGAKKPSTVATDAGRINRHIRPRLGAMILREIERSDVEQFYEDVVKGLTAVDEKTSKPRGRSRVTGGAGTAKKAVQLLSAIFKFAKKKGWADDNPARDIEMVRDGKRKRFLSFDEYRRLGDALRWALDDDGWQSPEAVNAIWILALTGCRKGEVLNLRRDEVQPGYGGLRFSDTKTGPQDRPCGQAAFAYLASVAPRQGAWVFPSRVTDGPIVKIDKIIRRICARAELSGVTCHTLRHSYATVANSLGINDLTIAGLLGHSLGTQTADYVHHIDDVLCAAADAVSFRIATAMKAVPGVGRATDATALPAIAVRAPSPSDQIRYPYPQGTAEEPGPGR